jgi:hypothetical protein
MTKHYSGHALAIFHKNASSHESPGEKRLATVRWELGNNLDRSPSIYRLAVKKDTAR